MLLLIAAGVLCDRTNTGQGLGGDIDMVPGHRATGLFVVPGPIVMPDEKGTDIPAKKSW
jgi:hypothetical protein